MLSLLVRVAARAPPRQAHQVSHISSLSTHHRTAIPQSPSTSPGFLSHDELVDYEHLSSAAAAVEERSASVPESMRPFVRMRQMGDRRMPLSTIRRPEDIKAALRQYQHQNTPTLHERFYSQTFPHDLLTPDLPFGGGRFGGGNGMRLMRVSAQGMEQVNRLLESLLHRTEQELQDGRAEDDAYLVANEEEQLAGNAADSLLPDGGSKQCANVLKKRRRMMRGHKHKKRLKQNRYKAGNR